MSTSLVFDLPVHRASVWIFNCYVIDAGDATVVVDPGLPVVAERAIGTIEELGRSLDDVASVVCTHAHPDHVAGVPAFSERSACDLLLPQRCQRYLEGEEPRNFSLLESTIRFLPVWGGQPFSGRALAELARHGTRVGIGGPSELTLDFEPSGFVSDGQQLSDALGWQVVETPGHTDDSTCFYHAESETLMSGDAVVTIDGRAWFNPEFVDREAARETEERLRSLPVSHLLPGHGEPIEASDVWRTARSFSEPPLGNGLLARCSRRFGTWQ